MKKDNYAYSVKANYYYLLFNLIKLLQKCGKYLHFSTILNLSCLYYKMILKFYWEMHGLIKSEDT